MATPEQRARRAAQRATAARVRARRAAGPIRARNIGAGRTKADRAQTEQGLRWATGEETPRNAAERRQAARLGALAAQGKADPRFYAAFKQYFYHKKTDETPNEADEEYDTDADEDEDEE